MFQWVCPTRRSKGTSEIAREHEGFAKLGTAPADPAPVPKIESLKKRMIALKASKPDAISICRRGWFEHACLGFYIGLLGIL